MHESQGEAPKRRRSTATSWRPVGTLALVGLNVSVFGLQWLWGATEGSAMLASMGAMVSSRISEGQWWRLVSCTVLHGGPLHIALNSYVLYIMGSFIERVLGTGRFLVLYVVSGVVASFGSYLWTDAVSVGASGAVFGLLASLGVLAFFPRGLLPAAMIPGARRAATTNLLLNLGISFLPMVDAAAHFTGAATGAALVYFGVVTPKVTTEPPQQWQLARRWLRFGIGTALLYAAVALFGITHGKPWRHSEPIEFDSRSIPLTEQRRQLPTFLPAAKPVEGELETLLFGDAYEPYFLLLRRQKVGAEADGSLELHKQLREQLSQAADSAAGSDSAPSTTTVRGRRITCATQSLPSQLKINTCIWAEAAHIVTLEGGYWPQNAARFSGLTLEIATRW